MSSDPAGSLSEVVSSELYRRACGQFATGVAIAAVTDVKGHPHALTINSFTSVSLQPPLILICLAHSVASLAVFRNCEYFGISILNAGQPDLSERFAKFTEDRFEGVGWHLGARGTPLMQCAIATLECALVRWFTEGDHDVFVGAVVTAEAMGGAPLVFFAGDYRRLGLD